MPSITGEIGHQRDGPAFGTSTKRAEDSEYVGKSKDRKAGR